MRPPHELLSTSVALMLTFSASYTHADELNSSVHALNDEILHQIRSDTMLNDDELELTKDEFKAYYYSDVLPRISDLDKHLAIAPIEISQNTFILTTAGVAPSSWGGNEYLYLISIVDGSPQIALSHKLDPEPKRGPDGYKLTDLWVHPNKDCGFNDFVHAVFQYGNTGGSGSTFTQIYAEYNRYESNYQLSVGSSPVRFSLNSCKAE